MDKQKISKGIVMFLLVVVIMNYLVSAGVGIRWDRESALVAEGGKECLTYGVYNPWPEETYVTIGLSEELQEVLKVQDVETILIPNNTASGNAIPIEFCFGIPREIYEKDCWVGDLFICQQECKEDQKTYEGDVIVRSVPPPAGGGGSSAMMAVSAPLRLKVSCIPQARNYTLIYFIVAVVSLGVVIKVLRKKYGRSKADRYKDRIKELQEKIKEEKNK